MARLRGLAFTFLVVLVASACPNARRPIDAAPRTTATAPAPESEPEASPARNPEPLLDPPITATAVQEPDMPAGVFHRVEQGQTLWRIARAYGVDLQELAEVNGVKDPRDLEAGRMLYVPGAQAALEVAPYPAPPPTAGNPTGTRGESPRSVESGFVWPVTGGGILSTFGVPRRTHRHAGIDISGTAGQDVLAAAAGDVVFSGSSPGGYGRLVILDHGGGIETLYAHNSKLLVNVGDAVERGQVLAHVGRTGNATTEHCHFEVRQEKVAVDPLRFFSPESVAALRGGPASLATGTPGAVAGKASSR